MSRLNSNERARLIKILGKLGSEFPNERAAAGLLATRLLKECYLSWDDAVVAASPAWKVTARRCLRHKHLLTPGQTRYCTNLELLELNIVDRS